MDELSIFNSNIDLDIKNEPTELEKQLYEALAIVIDEINFPLEITKGGLTICRFSNEQVDEIKAAYGLFTLIHNKRLSLGQYIEGKTSG